MGTHSFVRPVKLLAKIAACQSHFLEASRNRFIKKLKLKDVKKVGTSTISPIAIRIKAENEI